MSYRGESPDSYGGGKGGRRKSSSPSARRGVSPSGHRDVSPSGRRDVSPKNRGRRDVSPKQGGRRNASPTGSGSFELDDRNDRDLLSRRHDHDLSRRHDNDRHRDDSSSRGGGGAHSNQRRNVPRSDNDMRSGRPRAQLQSLDSIRDPEKRYIFQDVIGRGICGTVYSALDSEAGLYIVYIYIYL